MNIFERTVIALVHTLSGRQFTISEHKFIMGQFLLMPDFIRFSLKIITLIFYYWVLLTNFKTFNAIKPNERTIIVSRWRNSRLSIFRNWIRFFEALTIFKLASDKEWLL